MTIDKDMFPTGRHKEQNLPLPPFEQWGQAGGILKSGKWNRFLIAVIKPEEVKLRIRHPYNAPADHPQHFSPEGSQPDRIQAP